MRNNYTTLYIFYNIYLHELFLKYTTLHIFFIVYIHINYFLIFQRGITILYFIAYIHMYYFKKKFM
jgi:hypothetical protein